MAKPIVLSNGRQWATKKAALEHFRAMLHRYRHKARVSDPTDHDDLCALLVRYDASLSAGDATKIGVGVAFFSRELNAEAKWSTPGFHLHRIDGTSDDFSFHKAVNTDPPTL